MTDKLLATLDALAEKATPGPWHAVQMDGDWNIHICTDLYGENRIAFMAFNGPTHFNAALIAALANAYPLLRAEILRLREALLWISTHYESNDLSHLNYRVEAKRRADAALKGSEGGE